MLEVKRARMNVEICLDLDLYGEWQTASEELEVAREEAKEPAAPGKPQKRRMLNSQVPKLERRVAELEDRMAESTAVFELRALPRSKWQQIEAKYPAREDDPTDATFALDVGHFMTDALPACLVSVTNKASGEPIQVESTEWDPFLDEISQGQYNELALAILRVNRGISQAPFSPGVSRPILPSAPSLTPPAVSASPGSGSPDGSPAPSTSTTTPAT